MTERSNAVAAQERETGQQELLPQASQASLPTNQDSATILSLVSRVAENPNTDVEKIGKLLDLYERVCARNAEMAYHAAMAEMQTELPIIDERGVITVRDKETGVTRQQSTYARFEDINEVVLPILHRHGFSLTFRIHREGGEVTVTAVLSHREGHSERTSMTLPADMSGNKNQVQALGSSTSYGKRYTTEAILNITSRGQDDDGQAGGGPRSAGERRARAAESESGQGRDRENLIADLYAAAEEGEERLLAAWQALTEPQRRSVGREFGAIKQRARGR